MFDSAPGSNKQNKISELRSAIARAEQREDHKEVTLLEAELIAIEKGQEFNKEEFLLKTARVGGEPKHRVLKDMQGLSSVSDSSWTFDGIMHKKGGDYYSYERTFRDILSKFDVKTFQELVDKRSLELGDDIAVLDLFGGAYFLDDLSHVSRIVGVRLQNMDEVFQSEAFLEEIQGRRQHKKMNAHAQLLDSLVNSPKRKIIQGNLYSKKAWIALEKNDTQNGSEGFDVIVCRPVGPFRDSNLPNIESVKDGGIAREEIFVALLERALGVLSKDGGILFTQTPKLETDPNVLDIFWKSFMAKKQKEGYEFLFNGSGPTPYTSAFAVVRNYVER